MDLNNLIRATAQAITDNEKFFTVMLARRASELAQQCPDDVTSVSMSNFLTKRASVEPFISRRELREVYHKLFHQNNRFGSEFSTELAIASPTKPKLYPRPTVAQPLPNLADPVLANTLSQIFDKKGQYRPYSEASADHAAKVCLSELNRFAVKNGSADLETALAPKKIEVVGGKEDVLICMATYETPKGQTSVVIPVEINKETALIPTVFINKLGFVDLNKDNLHQYLIETAGQKLSINIGKMLNVIDVAKHGMPEPMSEMELIIAKAAAAKGERFDANGIVGQHVIDPKPIEQPRHPDADLFATKLASVSGGAEFKFGKQTVERCRNIIERTFAELGYPRVSIATANFDKDSMHFAVSIGDRVACKVAIKPEAQTVPAFMISSGAIYELSRNGISDMLASKEIDGPMLAMASPMYGLKSGELIEQVRTAMQDLNLAMAEDALNVLQNTNESAFKEAFVIYQAGLGGTVKTASAGTKCRHQTKTAHSQYVICSQTNLPIHKIFQDNQGNCLPLYRLHSETPSGASFIQSKVYFQ